MTSNDNNIKSFKIKNMKTRINKIEINREHLAIVPLESIERYDIPRLKIKLN